MYTYYTQVHNIVICQHSYMFSDTFNCCLSHFMQRKGYDTSVMGYIQVANSRINCFLLMKSWALSLISFSLLNMKNMNQSFIMLHLAYWMKLSIKLKSSDCKTKEANVSQGLLQYIAMLQKELKLYIPMLVKILTKKENRGLEKSFNQR